MRRIFKNKGKRGWDLIYQQNVGVKSGNRKRRRNQRLVQENRTAVQGICRWFHRAYPCLHSMRATCQTEIDHQGKYFIGDIPLALFSLARNSLFSLATRFQILRLSRLPYSSNGQGRQPRRQKTNRSMSMTINLKANKLLN